MLRRLIKILAYVGLVAFIAGATFVLVAIGRGYSYDFKTGRITLNGLVIISSAPSSANISQDGKLLHRRTPYRDTLEPGHYDFEVSREGFRTWKKRALVVASEVTHLQYILLVPNELKTELIAGQSGISKVVTTPDHSRVAYFAGGAAPSLWLLNPTSRESTRLYAPQAATADSPAEILEDVHWANDNNHLLLRSRLGDQAIYRVITSNNPTEATNLTTLFKVDLAGIRFNPNDWRELYWTSPEGLRKVNVSNQTISAVLAEAVTAFTFAGDRVIYVSQTPLGKTLWLLETNGRKRELIQALPDSPTYELAYKSYRDHDYLGVATGSGGEATLYSDIFSENPIAKVIAKSAGQLRFNTDGRYLAYSTAASLGVYDLEKSVSTTTSWPTKMPGFSDWFDNHHLLQNLDGKIQLVEFDGANLADLVSADPVTAAYPVNDGEFILSVTAKTANSDSQFQLTRIRP